MIMKQIHGLSGDFLELAFESQLSSLYQGSSKSSVKRWKWLLHSLIQLSQSYWPVSRSGTLGCNGLITLRKPMPALMNSLNSWRVRYYHHISPPSHPLIKHRYLQTAGKLNLINTLIINVRKMSVSCWGIWNLFAWIKSIVLNLN